jgi:hypothetical protein
MNTSHMDQFYDIYDVWHLPWWQHPVIKIGMVVFFVILCVSVIICIAIKFKRRLKNIPAWQEALKSLDCLRTSDMLNETMAKVFYTQLTVVIKHYIHKRYGFDIEGKTDREIVVFLGEQIIFPRDLIVVLQDILDHASRIKFANSVGLLEQMQQDLALSVRFVKESTPNNPRNS